MKVLKRVEPRSPVAVIDCINCNSTLELNRADCRNMSDLREMLFSFECPVCRKTNYVGDIFLK